MRFVLPSLLLVAIVLTENIGGQTNITETTDVTVETSTLHHPDETTTRNQNQGSKSSTDVTVETSTLHHPDETTPRNQNQGSKSSTPFEYAMVIVPLFLLLGLFGNFLTIIVINSKNFQHMSSSLILTALSISDTVLIIMLPFNKKFVLANLPTDPRSVSLFSCKLFFWFWRTAKMTSSWLIVLISVERFVAVWLPLKAQIINTSWLIVLISVERFVAVWLPLKAQIINTKKNMVVGIVGIYVCIGSFNMGWGVIADVLNGSCMPNVPYVPQYTAASKAMIVAGTLIYSIIPACVVFILNTLIITQLIIQRRRRKYLSDAPVNDQLSKTTAMLLTVSVVFIILVVPISIAHCFTLFKLNESIFSSDNPTVVIFREVAQTLEQLNYSINFFLYILSSERFRKQVKQLFCGFRMERKSSGRISFTTKTTKTGSVIKKREPADIEEKSVHGGVVDNREAGNIATISSNDTDNTLSPAHG